MRRTLVAALVTPTLTAAAAHAADAPVFTLGEIVINAARPAQAVDSADDIDLATIRRNDRENVGTALNLAAGVSLNKIGPRNEQMVYVRGFDLRQVPVYVDGIPVYVPYDGYVDLGRFTTFDLARIDVAKGFSSLIYGANTLGGAINLVSRRPTKAFAGEVGGGLTVTDHGETNGYNGYANVGANHGNWYMQAGVSYLNEDYYRLPADFAPAKGEDGGRRDNSYHHDAKLNLKLGLTPNATDEYTVNYINQHGVKGTPPYAGAVPGVNPRYWQWPYWNKESLYFLSSTAFGAHTLKVRAFHDTYANSLYAFDNSNYNSMKAKSSFKSWYDDYTDGIGMEDDFALSTANLLKVSLNSKTDVHREHNEGEPVRRTRDRTESLAFEDSHAFDNRLTLVTGLSLDRRESLEAQDYNATTKVVSDFPRANNSATNAQAGLFYQSSDTARWHATLARKSRFPTIKDRYSYRLGTALPNPSLKTEEANHFEIGVADKLGTRWQGEANVFHSDIRNLIQSVAIPASACASPPCSQMQNVGKAASSGVELTMRGKLESVDVDGNYTRLDRQNRSNPAILPTDTPRDKLFASVVWRAAPMWNVSASTEASSRRNSTSDGKQQAAGFAVANLKAGYRFEHGVLIEGGVRNLFDRLYAYTEGFPEPGRTWFVQFNAPL